MILIITIELCMLIICINDLKQKNYRMTKFSPLKISSSSWRTLLDIVRPNFSMRTTRIVTHSNFARISWLHALFKRFLYI